MVKSSKRQECGAVSVWLQAESKQAERRSELGRIDAECRDIFRQVRQLPPRRATGSMIRPGSTDETHAALERQLAPLQDRKRELEEAIASHASGVAELRRLASLERCEAAYPDLREMGRQILTAALQLSALVEKQRLAIEQIKNEGLELCGPLSRLLVFNVVGRPDIPGTPLSNALKEAHELGIVLEDELEFAFVEGVSQPPAVREATSAECDRQRAIDAQSLADRTMRAIRPIGRLAARAVEAVRSIGVGGEEPTDPDAADEPAGVIAL